jgi:hypothetical protein
MRHATDLCGTWEFHPEGGAPAAILVPAQWTPGASLGLVKWRCAGVVRPPMPTVMRYDPCLPPPGAALARPRHRHRDYEAIVPLRGAYRCRVDGHALALARGQVLVVPGAAPPDRGRRPLQRRLRPWPPARLRGARAPAAGLRRQRLLRARSGGRVELAGFLRAWEVGMVASVAS